MSLEPRQLRDDFDARHEKIETGAVVKSHRGVSGVEGGKGICYQWKEKEQCSKGDQCSLRHESNDRAKPTPKAEPPSEPRGKEMPWAEASLRNSIDRSAKHFLKGTCTKSPCEHWHPPKCQFYKTKSGCKFGAECSGSLKNNQTKSRRRMKAKVQLLLCKVYNSLSCVSQDTEPPDSTTSSRKGTRVLEPIRRVRFTRAALRQANIREKQGPSLGKIQVKIPHQRSPHAMKIENRSPGETARQERCAAEMRGKLPRKTTS